MPMVLSSWAPSVTGQAQPMRSVSTRKRSSQLQGYLPTLTAQPGVFVTVQDTGGRFGLNGIDNPWLSGLTGLVKTAALEWPKAR